MPMSNPLPEIPVGFRVVAYPVAAAICGCSAATLRREVDRGTGPRQVRLGNRRVGFRISDLQQWLESRASLTAAE
jgi:predicted DNA-binding transcriptional regulator AlpA